MFVGERKPLRFSSEDIKQIKSLVKDKNYRIILGENGINVFNSMMHSVGENPYDFYGKFEVDDDSSHAFYLGVELARAQIAVQLGKNYDQDNELDWGVAVMKKKVDLKNRPSLKITQKKVKT